MKHGIIMLCSVASLLLGGCGGTVSLEKTLEGAVINSTGEEIATEYVLNTDYLILYFGAHWSAPCQAFTPDLVDFYEKEKGGHLFQVLYVSNGNSEREMLAYMRKTKMQWPAVVYHSKSRKKLNQNYSGASIPRLVLLNSDGQILADTFNGDKFLGPQSVLDKLSAKLGKRQSDPVGISKITGKSLPTPEKIAELYKVEGIGAKANGKMAIINGSVTVKGDELDNGIIVEAITDAYVEISIEGNNYRLKPQKK